MYAPARCLYTPLHHLHTPLHHHHHHPPPISQCNQLQMSSLWDVANFISTHCYFWGPVRVGVISPDGWTLFWDLWAAHVCTVPSSAHTRQLGSLHRHVVWHKDDKISEKARSFVMFCAIVLFGAIILFFVCIQWTYRELQLSKLMTKYAHKPLHTIPINSHRDTDLCTLTGELIA